MEDKKLGAVEARFADLIWDNAPINSTALVRLCAKELDWKKSTTYTVLKKLCERGIFQNIDGTVTALVSREDFAAAQSERFVEETFAGFSRPSWPLSPPASRSLRARLTRSRS